MYWEKNMNYLGIYTNKICIILEVKFYGYLKDPLLDDIITNNAVDYWKNASNQI